MGRDRDSRVQELVRRAREGDRDAFDALAARSRTRLEAFVESQLGHRLRGRFEVADVVQEALRVAYESIGKFEPRGPESFDRWLATIAKHLIWNTSKKRAWDQIELNLDVADSATSPSRGLRRNERFERLESALAGLPDDYRTVVRLARIKGLRLAEVAQRMGRSSEAVRKLLARALLALRQSFGDTESLRLPPRRLFESASESRDGEEATDERP